MKKILLIWLVIIFIISPWTVIGQEIIPPTEEFVKDVEGSWLEATIIWTWVYNIVRPLWDRNVVPIWRTIVAPIRGWIENQTVKLQDTLKEDKEKIRETAQKEIEEQRQNIGQRIWQTILSTLGF